MTTSSTGETANKRKTDGEEARGGERDAHVGKLSGDMEFVRWDLGRWGGEGGPEQKSGT